MFLRRSGMYHKVTVLGVRQVFSAFLVNGFGNHVVIGQPRLDT